MVSNLVSKYFGSPRLGHTIKNVIENFRLLIQRYAQF